MPIFQQWIYILIFLSIGESGTGKDELARIIHNTSENWKKIFVTLITTRDNINMEYQMKGVKEKVFTQVNSSEGILNTKGTLFLSEIGEMTLENQVQFLDIFSKKIFYLIGGEGEENYKRKLEARIISCTNKNLRNPKNEFRQDLYYRIAERVIQIPKLNDRKNDILEIARFLYCKECIINKKDRSKDFLKCEYLKNYINNEKLDCKEIESIEKFELQNKDWSNNNVRELYSFIKFYKGLKSKEDLIGEEEITNKVIHWQDQSSKNYKIHKKNGQIKSQQNEPDRLTDIIYNYAKTKSDFDFDTFRTNWINDSKIPFAIQERPLIFDLITITKNITQTLNLLKIFNINIDISRNSKKWKELSNLLKRQEKIDKKITKKFCD